LDEDGWRRGWPSSEALSIAEPVLELEVTPNRVDCFGVYGWHGRFTRSARRRSAAAPWEEDAPAEGEGKVDDYASVRVDVPDLCPRFTARVFTDVTIGPSPLGCRRA
jgi:phenylalanyl-tRNA synthetase beta chain